MDLQESFGNNFKNILTSEIISLSLQQERTGRDSVIYGMGNFQARFMHCSAFTLGVLEAWGSQVWGLGFRVTAIVGTKDNCYHIGVALHHCHMTIPGQGSNQVKVCRVAEVVA